MVSRSIPFLSSTPSRSIRVGVRQVWSTVQSMARARATRRLLAEMDGRILADIGVSRAQVATELLRPFWDYEAR